MKGESGVGWLASWNEIQSAVEEAVFERWKAGDREGLQRAPVLAGLRPGRGAGRRLQWSLTAPSPQPTRSRVLFLGGWLLFPLGMQGKYPELRLLVQVLRTQARLICPRRGLAPPKTWCSRCGVGAQPHPHLTSSPRLGPRQPFLAWFYIQGLDTRRPQLFKAFTLVR